MQRRSFPFHQVGGSLPETVAPDKVRLPRPSVLTRCGKNPAAFRRKLLNKTLRALGKWVVRAYGDTGQSSDFILVLAQESSGQAKYSFKYLPYCQVKER